MTTTISTPSDTEVVMERIVAAPRELVWEAFTSSEHLPNWMLGPEGWTMPVCELDLRPGGAWHIEWRNTEDGREMEMNGVYREVEAPERLVQTESWGGDWPETLNTMVLTQEDGRTRITTTVVYPSKEARDAAIATGMADGADRSFDLLDELLARVG